LGLTKQQIGKAIEDLKDFNKIPHDSHGTILSNGDYIPAGENEPIDNIFNY
jgi:hypothetical protein